MKFGKVGMAELHLVFTPSSSSQFFTTPSTLQNNCVKMCTIEYNRLNESQCDHHAKCASTVNVKMSLLLAKLTSMNTEGSQPVTDVKAQLHETTLSVQRSPAQH